MHNSLFNRFTRTGLALAGVALAAGSHSALAAEVATTMGVSSTVAASCTVAATPLAFGTYSQVAAANTDGTSTVTVNCTTGSAWDIALGAGAGTGATVANRVMTSGLNVLNYTLYRETGRTTVWGVTDATNTVAGTGTGAAQAQTVFGRIFADQSDTAPIGTYTDTVAVDVTF